MVHKSRKLQFLKVYIIELEQERLWIKTLELEAVRDEEAGDSLPLPVGIDFLFLELDFVVWTRSETESGSNNELLLLSCVVGCDPRTPNSRSDPNWPGYGGNRIPPEIGKFSEIWEFREKDCRVNGEISWGLQYLPRKSPIVPSLPLPKGSLWPKGKYFRVCSVSLSMFI